MLHVDVCFCQGRNVFPLLEEPVEGEQRCGKISLPVWNSWNPKSPNAALQVLELLDLISR